MLHWSLFQSLATLRLLFLLLLIWLSNCLNGLLGIESWTWIGVLKSLGDNLSADMFFVDLEFWLLHPSLDLSDVPVKLSNSILDRVVLRRGLIVEAGAVKVDFCCVWNELTRCRLTQIIDLWIGVYLNFDYFSLLLSALFLKLGKKHFLIDGFDKVWFPWFVFFCSFGLVDFSAFCFVPIFALKKFIRLFGLLAGLLWGYLFSVQIGVLKCKLCFNWIPL